MAATTADPQTLPERLIAWAIVSTWWLWLIGGLYIVGPVLGWALAMLVMRGLYFGNALPPAERASPPPWPIWMWLLGMGAMLPILWIGHNNFDLGTATTIKSSIGWAKGWALLALYPLAGAALSIRPEVIYRAVCTLGKQTLWLAPLFIICPYIGMPEILWVSPLKVLGGSGDEYFAAVLYTIEPGVGTARWQFFAPWSPAAGMVAIIHLLCAIEEKDGKRKAIGICAALIIALFSQSRLAMVAIALIWPISWGVSRLGKPSTWFAGVVPLLLGGLFAPAILAFLEKAQSDFSGARADSSRVRSVLGHIAVERWQHEAYWFGHGIVERGPHIVEFMPIGSHHSWYGLLFVKGVCGLIAFAIPIGSTLFSCFLAAMKRDVGRVGLSMILVYFLYSFGENMETLVYLCWPALVIVGIALRQPTPDAAPVVN